MSAAKSWSSFPLISIDPNPATFCLARFMLIQSCCNNIITIKKRFPIDILHKCQSVGHSCLFFLFLEVSKSDNRPKMCIPPVTLSLLSKNISFEWWQVKVAQLNFVNDVILSVTGSEWADNQNVQVSQSSGGQHGGITHQEQNKRGFSYCVRRDTGALGQNVDCMAPYRGAPHPDKATGLHQPPPSAEWVESKWGLW